MTAMLYFSKLIYQEWAENIPTSTVANWNKILEYGCKIETQNGTHMYGC